MNEGNRRLKELKEGDVVYKISSFGVVPLKVRRISEYGWVELENYARIRIIHSKTYYFTREEAEKEIKARGKINEKKRLMYEYECKLNEKMGLNDFLIKY